MNVKRIILLVAMLTVYLSNTFYGNAVIREMLSEEDRCILNRYLKEDFEKEAKDTPIVNYIADKIKNGSDSVVVENGIRMIFSLSKKHKPLFEGILIDFFQSKINDPSLRSESIYPIVVCMQALGSVRTDSAIQFLLPLLDPVEGWPEKIRESLLANQQATELIRDIRYASMSALLPSDVEKGKELLPIVEEKVNNLQDDDSIKVYLLRNIESFKKRCRGEVDETIVD